MKKLPLLIAIVCLAWAVSACAQEAADTELAKPESLEDKASYSIGMNMGRGMAQQGVDLNLDYLIRGIADAMAEGGTTLLTDEEMQTAMQEFQQEMIAKQQAKAKEEAEKNQAEGEAYLAENKARDGVTVTDSGLQYEVVTAGEGASPSADDRVSVHYTGTLIDGTKFDSSHDRGQPATFPVSGVIKGWTEALQLMNVGSKYKLAIPSDLAYGERGSPPRIGPGATLLFEVELLSIEGSDG
ncbi:MAG: FKBP-type peptidyl-prolyl cis-trans isomerase [Acidobacteriota bacterium]